MPVGETVPAVATFVCAASDVYMVPEVWLLTPSSVQPEPPAARVGDVDERQVIAFTMTQLSTALVATAPAGVAEPPLYEYVPDRPPYVIGVHVPDHSATRHSIPVPDAPTLPNVTVVVDRAFWHIHSSNVYVLTGFQTSFHVLPALSVTVLAAELPPPQWTEAISVLPAVVAVAKETVELPVAPDCFLPSAT